MNFWTSCVLATLVLIACLMQEAFAHPGTIERVSVKYRVLASGGLVTVDNPAAHYAAIYSTLARRNGRYTAKCRVTVTGRSQFD